jgi:hypothetical protein
VGYPRIVNGTIDIGAFEYQGDGLVPAATQVIPDAAPVLPVRTSLPPLDMNDPRFAFRALTSNAAPMAFAASPVAPRPAFAFTPPLRGPHAHDAGCEAFNAPLVELLALNPVGLQRETEL